MAAPRASIRRKLKEILATREYEIPSDDRFEGSETPRLYLLHLLRELKVSERSLPNAGAWKIAFTDGTSELALFDMEPAIDEPHIVEDATNYRYTITDKEGSIQVENEAGSGFAQSWSHDALINEFACNAVYLILVRGSWNRQSRLVNFASAEFLWEPRTTQLIRLIADGTIVIDFDSFLQDSASVLEHGTEFRIRPDDLHSLYAEREQV